MLHILTISVDDRLAAVGLVAARAVGLPAGYLSWCGLRFVSTFEEARWLAAECSLIRLLDAALSLSNPSSGCDRGT